MKRIKSFSGITPFYFVATPIGNLQEFSPRAVSVLQDVDFICVEDTRVSQTLLNFYQIKKPLYSVHKFNEQATVDEIITKLNAGQKGAFLSDAGYPLLSDPGSVLLNKLIENDFPVSVINGPSALLPALVLSNLPVIPFTFLGFLPSKEGEQTKVLEQLKERSETLVIYEAPHRVNKTVKNIFKVFGERKLVIARELTKINEEYIYTTLKTYTGELPSLRGELVLVVEGAKDGENKDINLQDYYEHVTTLINKNYKSNEAIKLVALLFNVNKNDLYDYFIKRQKD